MIPSRDLLFSPQELAEAIGQKVHTLADWRCDGRGPAYYVIGRKIWYSKERVATWFESKLKETKEDGIKEAQREVALPVRTRRPGVQRSDRLGRHGTKRERREADGGRPSQGSP